MTLGGILIGAGVVIIAVGLIFGIRVMEGVYDAKRDARRDVLQEHWEKAMAEWDETMRKWKEESQ